MATTLGCSDIGIRKLEFVTKNQLLCIFIQTFFEKGARSSFKDLMSSTNENYKILIDIFK